MSNNILILDMAVANQVFTCVNRLDISSEPQLMGVIEKVGNRTRFTLAEQADTPDGHDRLAVYTHLPKLTVANNRFLVVETGTKGVLEIRGYQKSGDTLEAFEIITG